VSYVQKEDWAGTVHKSFLCRAGTAVASWLYFQVVVVEVVAWLHLVVAVAWLHLVEAVVWLHLVVVVAWLHLVVVVAWLHLVVAWLHLVVAVAVAASWVPVGWVWRCRRWWAKSKATMTWPEVASERWTT